jgi:hypothetical protein
MMDGRGTTFMSKALIVTLALTAGLVGGLLSRYIAPPSAFAQGKATVTKEVRAQSFTLVDPSDQAIGTFTLEPVGPQVVFVSGPNVYPDTRHTAIVLRDSTGREIWRAGGSVTAEATK